MNFFRSILSEDLDPPEPENTQRSEPKSPKNPSYEHGGDSDDDDGGSDGDEPSTNPNSAADSGGAWSFGGLIKTFATRSESVIETYRRDLKEFGSGLQKETAAFREAVKELPVSIQVGAVGHAIDGVWKSTAEIIAHGKDALLAPSDGESDSDSHNYTNQSLSSKRYNRFDAQLQAIQSDANTYCEEPEDLEDYSKWKLGFVLELKSEEIKTLIEENATMEGVYKRVVPNLVDRETFWCRYFFRVHKLKQQEDVRANLVKRAISIDYDEELTWDVDDDEEEEANGPSKANTVTVENKELKEKTATYEAEVGSIQNRPNVDNSEKGIVTETRSEKEVNNAEAVSKSDEKVDSAESCKDSDVSIVSTQPSLPEEEDLGWDEIEDLGSNDERKLTHAGGSPSRADLRKRLSAADEDEDLNWDIEDDDEPVPKPDTK
ncbi:uncharacterized protein LOC130770108 [Actinidia eriantha]|uniref:uncharacterized protein LOC130770108 n=1 Tax=Actinidia eriantha TaxID=165200 RepID=UPI00258AE4D7|nr:uncharacterized protein LOC130770108 [Actinidia eriantha]